MKSPKITVQYTLKEKGKNGSSITADPYTFDDVGSLLQFTKQALVGISVDALREEQGKGFDENPVTLVDGKRGKTLESVNPLGKIQFISRKDIKNILRDAFDAIDSRTFKVTGRYLRSNVVTYNGKQVANNRSSFETWLESVESFSPRDRIRFVNTAPYARKLERFGITKDKRANPFNKRTKWRNAKKHEKKPEGTKYLVPNGIYALAYRAISRKHRANVMIKFDLLPGNYMNITGPGTTYKTGESKGKSYLYPTILIYATPSGLQGLSS